MRSCSTRFALSFMAAMAAMTVMGSTAFAQYGLPSYGSAQASQGPVIQIHHHHYYQQSGIRPLIAQQGDPAAAGGPGYFGARPNGNAPTDFGGSWGGIGLYGYLGQQGQQSGLIVSRVDFNSPASQLGLVAGDIILEINGQDINDMTTRQLQILLLGLTTQEKEAVTMEVWNSHTRRASTLKGVFEDQAVDSFDDGQVSDDP